MVRSLSDAKTIQTETIDQPKEFVRNLTFGVFRMPPPNPRHCRFANGITEVGGNLCTTRRSSLTVQLQLVFRHSRCGVAERHAKDDTTVLFSFIALFPSTTTVSTNC